MPEKKEKSSQDILAEILLEERAEKTAEARAKKAAVEAKLHQWIEDENDKLAKRLFRQANCDHLMGNHIRGKTKPPREIHDLSLHTYSSKRSRIRCNRCGFVWTPNTTQEIAYEWITRKPYPNPTKKSWQDVMMLFNSTSELGNKRSKSFVVETLNDEMYQ